MLYYYYYYYYYYWGPHLVLKSMPSGCRNIETAAVLSIIYIACDIDNCKPIRFSGTLTKEFPKLLERHITSNKRAMYSPLVLVVLIEQNDKICILSDCLFWNPKVFLCKIEAVRTAMAAETEIFLDRPLLLYRYVVKHHDAR